MAGEFAPGSRPDGPDCADRAAYGAASAIDQYITKQYLLAEEDYPKDACPNRYYSTAKIDNWQVTTAMTGALSTMNIPSCTITCANVTASGTVAANSFTGPTISGLQAGINAAAATASSKKGFDIAHHLILPSITLSLFGEPFHNSCLQGQLCCGQSKCFTS